jgi:hypothetical protein
MRWLAGLLASVTLSSAHFEASINGVWVLNQRLSRFASSALPERVVMQVDSTTSGWVCVLVITTDARGQHLQSDQYAIHPASAVPVAQKTATATTNRSLLRHQGTGVVEEWAIATGGLLLIQRPHPTAPGTKHDRLVFQRAERRGLVVNPWRKKSIE